jgi:hypothetical protein
MTPDLLDDLLDCSAPATRAADPADLREMVSDAAPKSPRGRRRRIGIAAGALAALLLGGAGLATAGSDWRWGAGMENPEHSVTYTSPTWGQCELRLGEHQAVNPFDQPGIDRVIDAWFADADLESQILPLVPKYLLVLEESQAADPVAITDQRLPDLNYWLAVEQAVGELLHDELSRHGYGGRLSSGASQVHCEGEDWG